LEDHYKKEAPSGVSLLAYALKKKLLSSSDYLAWAQENYHLPRIQAKFFETRHVNGKQWTQWKELHKWSWEIQPLAAWDDHLIVGCLELPSTFPVELKPIFLLCEYTDLEKAWVEKNTLDSQAIAATATTSSSTAGIPNAIPSPIVTSAGQPSESGVILLEDEISESEIKKSVTEMQEDEASTGMPEGLSEQGSTPVPPVLLKMKKADSDVVPLLHEEPKAKPAAPILEKKIEKPEPRTETIELKVGEATNTKTLKISIPSPLIATPSSPSTPAPKPATPMKPATPPTVATGNTPTPILNLSLNPLKPTPAPTTLSTPKTTTPPAPATVTAAAAAKKTPDHARFLFNVLFDKHKKDFDSKAHVVFDKMKSYFEKTMILSLDVQEAHVRPYLWNDSFISTSNDNIAVDLSIPSLFRIVCISQKAFHGQVVVNDCNEKFFDDWNQGTMPDHVTMVPLIINGRMAGMILGVGEKSSYNHAVLKFMENLSIEFSQQLSQIIEATVPAPAA